MHCITVFVFAAVTRGGDHGTIGLFVGAGINESFVRDNIVGTATDRYVGNGYVFNWRA